MCTWYLCFKAIFSSLHQCSCIWVIRLHDFDWNYYNFLSFRRNNCFKSFKADEGNILQNTLRVRHWVFCISFVKVIQAEELGDESSNYLQIPCRVMYAKAFLLLLHFCHKQSYMSPICHQNQIYNCNFIADIFVIPHPINSGYVSRRFSWAHCGSVGSLPMCNFAPVVYLSHIL